MLQRKQTLYLLIALLLLVSMCFFPFVKSTVTPSTETIANVDGSINKITVVAANEVEMDIFGLYYDNVKQADFIYFSVLLFLTIGTIIACIAFFKNRLIQIRICYIIWLFLIGILAFEGIYIYRLQEILTNSPQFLSANSYSVTLLFPLLALFLVWLGYRGIVKDEALVRSLDRIR